MSQHPNPRQNVQLSNVPSSGDDNTPTSSNHVFVQDGLHADSHWVFIPRHVTVNSPSLLHCQSQMPLANSTQLSEVLLELVWCGVSIYLIYIPVDSNFSRYR